MFNGRPVHPRVLRILFATVDATGVSVPDSLFDFSRDTVVIGHMPRSIPLLQVIFHSRVGGSIPPLATTPTFLKRMGFSPSPADYRRTIEPKIDRPSDI